MLSAFNLIFSGGIYVPAEILPRRARPISEEQAPGEPSTQIAELGLTARQLEVLALMAQGKSNKAICRILDLAEPTVKIHVSAVLSLEGVQPHRGRRHGQRAGAQAASSHQVSFCMDARAASCVSATC